MTHDRKFSQHCFCLLWEGNYFLDKYPSLGLTVKFLIRDKTMVSLLNHFGHCARDETIRRTDLGLEETLFKTTTLVPC